MIRSEIISTGRHLPERVVTNHDLEQWMETSDEWIRQRTGIRERRWVPEGGGVGGTDLAKVATERALEKADMKVEEIDAIVFATLSPDHMFPGSGCFLQAKLGLKNVPAIDVRNQCSGFLYGLSVADAWIRSGTYRRVLLVGAEVQSTGLDLTTRGRDVSVIFGDGAGVAILGPTEDEGRGVLSLNLGADGRFAKELWTEVPGSVRSPQNDPALIAEGRAYAKMDGAKVFKHAVVKMPQATRKALEDAGMTTEDLKLLVPHQANKRIIDMVGQSLGLAPEQVVSNIERYGNTTAATLPIGLDEAWEEGRVKRGDVVALTAFGAGFTWGSAVVRL